MTMLLERDRELDRLERLVRSAAAGSGELVVLQGEAGIGKTGLLRAARKPAADHGVRVLGARGAELEGDLPFGLVRELLGAAASELPLDGAAALARPVLAPVADTDGQELFATLHGLHWLVSDLTADGPLLIVVDDAHWADGPSLRFLAYLAHRLDGLAVSMLVATRPVAGDGTADLIAALTGHPGCDVLRPGPLGPHAVRTVVDGVLGTPDGEFVDACRAATGGNPFLLVALLAELRDAGTVPLAGAAPSVARVVPDRVERAVRRRLGQLGPDAVALARAAAVLGDGTPSRRAGALAGLDGSRAAEVTDRLVGAQLIRRSGEVTFVHPLVRAAVEAAVGPGELSLLHRRAAGLLVADGEPEDAVVGHLLAARPAADPWVVGVLRSAAARAVPGGAPEVAARYLRRALSEPPAEEERFALLLALGEAEFAAGEPAALETLRTAHDLAGSRIDRARSARMLSRLLFGRGRIAEAVDVGGAAVDGLGDAEPALARILDAELIVTAVQDRDAVEAARRRVARYAGAPDPTGPGAGHLLAAMGLEELVACRSRARALALVDRGLTDPDLVDDRTLSVLPGALITLAICGEPGRARLTWARTADRARARGGVFALAAATAFGGHAAHLAGDVTAAVADLALGRDLARMSADSVVPGFVAGWLASALVDADDPAAAEAELAASVAVLSTPLFAAVYLLAARGRLRIAQRRHADAVADLRECARRAAAHGSADPAPCAYLADLARALAGTGAVDEARRTADRAVGAARRWGAPHLLSDALSAAASVAADGRDLAGEAVAVATGFPLHRARALVELGASHRRAGERVASRAPLRDGLDLASGCGAVALARRAQDELVRTGARPRRLRTTGPASLTPTERRVATLAADGLTNREIAQTLFVSAKTVETHLGHAYRKLGVTARGHLGRVLQGWAPGPT